MQLMNILTKKIGDRVRLSLEKHIFEKSYMLVSTFRLTFWCSLHVIYEEVKLLNLYTEENIFFWKNITKK